MNDLTLLGEGTNVATAGGGLRLPLERGWGPFDSTLVAADECRLAWLNANGNVAPRFRAGAVRGVACCCHLEWSWNQCYVVVGGGHWTLGSRQVISGGGACCMAQDLCFSPGGVGLTRPTSPVIGWYSLPSLVEVVHRQSRGLVLLLL